jgi:hypothetical protein
MANVIRWLFCAGGKAQGHNQYDPKTGTKVDGATFSVTYGSGYAKGDVYTDRVSVGALTAHQAVGCATDTDATDSNDKQLDGIMGMGFNSGSKSVNNGYPQNPHATQSAANAGKRIYCPLSSPFALFSSSFPR